MNKFSHPLESVFGMAHDDFDIEKEYAAAETDPGAVAELEAAPTDHKDEDDILVEQRIDEVYTTAMATFASQNEYIEIIDPKYAARSAEVAAQYLNIALAAANSRAKVKSDRKKTNAAFVPYNSGGKTTNNIVIADRNQILKMIDMDGMTKELK